MTVPITFESDCNTETYTEAKEREHSRKHEQATCLPITLMRYPAKKQKVGKTELNYDTDDINFGKTGESFVFKESKSKSFKEID